MTESMIERVAKAICHAEGKDKPWELDWHVFEAQAIAAVRALREPTDEMLDAGVEAKMRLYERLEAEGKDVRTMVVADHPAGTIYQAMIDAALSDTEERG